MTIYSKIKRVFTKRKSNLFDIAIKKINHEDFKFIQIGACDGRFSDLIYKYIKKYRREGVRVEPVPYYFEQLKETYKASTNLIFVNKAISNGFKRD